LLVSFNRPAQYADTVVSYDPGTGYSPGFTNGSAALGEPSRVTPGDFGGPVDPFDPPVFAHSTRLGGRRGSLTVQFRTPVLNHPNNRFGIDFLIFRQCGHHHERFQFRNF